MVKAKIIVPVIVGVVFLAVVVTIIVVHVQHNKRPPVHPPTPDRDKCYVSVDPTVLKPCTPGDPDTCDTCKGGLYGCFTVSNTGPNPSPYPIHFKEPKSGEPNTLYVPDGNWCLPAQIKTLKCNEFSGFPILTKLTDTEYAWKCQCKYPTIFENKGAEGDCTRQVACEGLLSDQNKFVCPTGASYCKPGEQWIDDPTWDPTYGTCNCAKGLKPIDRSNRKEGIWDFECQTDQCSPGVSDGKNCKCPKPTGSTGGYFVSYINCPGDMPDDKKDLCDAKYPLCINDPCNPGGVYDPGTGGCKCDPGKHFQQVQDTSSPIGYACINPCSGKFNPCADRGTCYTDDKGVAKCKDCKYGWYQDDKDMCANPMKTFGDRCDGGYQCLSGHCNPEYVFGGHHICTF